MRMLRLLPQQGLKGKLQVLLRQKKENKLTGLLCCETNQLTGHLLLKVAREI